MSAADLLAGTVFDAAAALMNDSAKSTYLNSVQVPYLNMALKELQEKFEENNIPSTQLTSAVITVPAGITEIVYNGGTSPTLPDDMIEPAEVWERQTGAGQEFISMTKRDYLPHDWEGVLLTQFVWYIWEDQAIKFLPSLQSNDIKIDYIKFLFNPVTDENSPINIINAETFLEYRTAALMAEFIERNTASANGLNTYALMAIERAIGIGSKGKQNIMTRRRPFRSAYKKRGWM